MSINSVLPPIKPIAFREAGELGRAIWVTQVLGGVTAAALTLTAWMGYQTVQMSRRVADEHPLVIHVNDQGRPQSLDLTKAGGDEVNEVDIQYFATQFMQLFYGRDRRIIDKTYSNAGYFFTPQLFQQVQAEDAQTQWLPKFLAGGDENVEIDVKSVSPDLSAKPKYSALIEFDKVYLSSLGVETKRVRWTTKMYFTINRNIGKKSGYRENNPLGFQIYYLQTTEAFGKLGR